jgi:hypothetical protein
VYFKPSGILNRISELSDKELKLCQYNLNSIAWILWHVARCEDVAINRILFDREQVINTNNFFHRLKVLRKDIGTSMSYTEVIDLSNQIDSESLLEYITEVATKTQKVLGELPSEQLDQVPNRKFLEKVFFKEGALNKNSEWVADYYSNRKKGWFLGHLGLTHPRGHLGQIILIRKLIGLGSGE